MGGEGLDAKPKKQDAETKRKGECKIQRADWLKGIEGPKAAAPSLLQCADELLKLGERELRLKGAGSAPDLGGRRSQPRGDVLPAHVEREEPGTHVHKKKLGEYLCITEQRKLMLDMCT